MKNLVIIMVLLIFCVNLACSQHFYVNSDSGIKSKTEVLYSQDKKGDFEKIFTTYSYFLQNGLPVYSNKVGDGLYRIDNIAFVYKPTGYNSVEGCKYGIKKTGKFKIIRESSSVLHSESFSSEDSMIYRSTIIQKPYGYFHKQGNGMNVKYYKDKTKTPEGYSYYITSSENRISNFQLISDRKFNDKGEVITYVSTDTMMYHSLKHEIYYDYYNEETEKYFEIKTSQIKLTPNLKADSNAISEFYNSMFFTNNDFYSLQITPKYSDNICDLFSKCGIRKITELKTGNSYTSTYGDKWEMTESSTTTYKNSKQTKKVNLDGRECLEVVIDSDTGNKEVYYIDQSLPFVNYGNFNYSFEGFVIKSSRELDNFGTVDWQVDIEEISIPSNYLIHFSEYFFQFIQNQ